MRDVMEIAAMLALLLGLVFLFDGEPDVWDKLHKKAMGTCAALSQGEQA